MSTFVRLLAAASLGGGVLLGTGCGAASADRLVSPDEPEPAASAAASKAAAAGLTAGPAIGARDIRTVLGKHRGGVVLTADPVVGVENYYTFEASRTKSGTAAGTFRFVSAYQGVEVAFSGVITCYTVHGSQARIGGVVTASSFAEIPVGTTETWSITDNGPLANGEVDTGSSLLGGDAGYAQGYCANGLPYQEHPYLSGGVTITY